MFKECPIKFSTKTNTISEDRLSVSVISILSNICWQGEDCTQSVEPQETLHLGLLQAAQNIRLGWK
jgi:hypothetical protein